MPRWLSEGISVYEELEKDPSWGQSMNPTYRQMILGEDFVPLSKLSSAFLQPRTPMHLQFAYFEASLAVRYMVEKHGMERLKKLLVDLGMGVPMQEALARIYGDTDALDADFKQFATAAANKLFTEEPDEKEELPKSISLADLKQFVIEHPKHFTAKRKLAAAYIEGEKWPEAIEILEGLDKLWPADADTGGTLSTMASVYRKLERADKERQTLERIVQHSSDNVSALTRLIELTEAAQQWDQVQVYANKLLAVQPLIAVGHNALAAAAKQAGDQAAVASSYAALLDLQPLDAGRYHFELAAARYELNELDEARTHVLIALEETPRFRVAQQLLLKIADKRKQAAADGQRTLTLPDLDKGPPQP